MSQKSRLMWVVAVLGLCIVLVGTVAAQSNGPNAPEVAVTTKFSYQGQIKRNGVLFDGPCTMRFTLWDAATAGLQQASYTVPAPVTVSAGVFAVEVDFGAQFRGDARWIQTETQCADDAGYTTLPRVALTPTPYAIGLMPGAQSLGTLSGTGGIFRATNNGEGAALVGLANSATGVTYGVLGNSSSPNGNAVWGYAINGGTGVHGVSGGSGSGVWGSSATGAGVYGESTNFNGVRGVAHNINHGAVVGVHDGGGIAVYGLSTTNVGAYGESTSGWGVYGKSQTSIGVYGESADFEGVRGTSHNANHGGVVGVNDAAGGTAVYGVAPNSGYAMRANGNASQSLNNGGWAKAMLYVDPFQPVGQQIVRCYNSQASGSGISTPPCGFTVTNLSTGRWNINLGFDISQRFAVASVSHSPIGVAIGYGPNSGMGIDANTIYVSTYLTYQSPTQNYASSFTVIVY